MCLDNKKEKEEKSLYTDKSNIYLRREKKKMNPHAEPGFGIIPEE
jgi:hypothetical protein